MKEMDKTVLCYLHRGDEYLLLYRNKKNNDINEGKWIGIGGHIEPNETKELALKREVEEETGLLINSFKYRGDLIFINDDYEEIMYLYTSDDFSGELIECDEGELHWIEKDKILELNLWEGDRTFLPKLLNTDAFIKMTLRYSKNQLIEVVEEQ